MRFQTGAGNPVEAGAVTAEDSIPAKLDVTITGTGGAATRPVTRRAITVTVSSDESLSSNPVVTINRVGDDYSLVRFSQGEALPTGAANRWIYTSALSTDGLYAVRVSAVDRGGRIEAVAGLDETDFTSDSLKDPDVILFEVDTRLPSPTLIPEDGSQTDNPDVFIRIVFEGETAEYGLTKETDNETPPPVKTRKATDDPAMVDVSFDTHNKVQLVSATFNGEDVTDNVITRDNLVFTFYPGNLALGDHRLELEARDVAGNWWTDTLNFTLIERLPYKIPINPGVNLISLPDEPESESFTAIFDDEPDIGTVVTYDNATGLWFTATRQEDGTFTGDLTTIDGSHGYWVVSNAAFDLKVELRTSLLFAAPPSYIQVFEGWNLVPVTDIDWQPAGTAIKATEYFANIDATVAFGYDSNKQELSKLSLTKDSNDKIYVGSAYWVYANKPGIIIP